MAVGKAGRPVRNSVPRHNPSEFASRVGAHIHSADPKATIGGPGPTKAPGASLSGSSGSSPYGGAGGDADHDGM